MYNQELPFIEQGEEIKQHISIHAAVASLLIVHCIKEIHYTMSTIQSSNLKK